MSTRTIHRHHRLGCCFCTMDAESDNEQVEPVVEENEGVEQAEAEAEVPIELPKLSVSSMLPWRHFITCAVFKVVQEAQAQHGLRHNDYIGYRCVVVTTMCVLYLDNTVADV